MGKHRHVSNGVGFGRNRLKQKPDEPHYFVPSFSVRRQTEQSPELNRLVRNLRKVLGKSYEVYKPEQISMTMIEQAKMIERLRDAGEHPEPETVSELAVSVQETIAAHLAGVPRTIEMPIGQVDRFGHKGVHRKLGFTLLGWKGYQARYAREDSEGQRLPLGIVVDENRIGIGAIAAAFAHNDHFIIDGLARTPHAAFAQKRTGRITDGELRAVNDEISEFMPGHLAFEDPVIYLRTERTQNDCEVLFPRMPDLSNELGAAS